MNETDRRERLKDLQDEVKDCEKSLANDTEALRDAQKWVDAGKVQCAEAVIALHEFKQQHGL